MNLPQHILEGLLETGPHRHKMGLRRADVRTFFQPTDEREAILAERARWIIEAPASHLGALPGSAPLINDFAQFLGDTLPGGLDMSCGATPLDACRALGHALEPDWLLLSMEAGFPALAAAVCFPSTWALEEKMGLSLGAIHAPVPGLNASLGDGIQRFIGKLEEGVGWERHNWGLSRSAERNQHPRRQLARLDHTVRLEEVWWRVEHQSLVRLKSGLAFGIRIHSIPLAQVAADPKLRHGMVEALKTMDGEIAAYKGLAGSRARLMEILTAGISKMVGRDSVEP